MKYLLIIVLFFSKASVFANRVDSLKSEKEIEGFIHELYKIKYPGSFDDQYYSFTIKKPDSVSSDISCDGMISTWNLTSWQKIDFNKDNLTDLFVIIYIRNINEPGASYHICVAIDNGDNTFSLTRVPDHFMPWCYAAMPLIINGEALLLYRHHKTEVTQDTVMKVTQGAVIEVVQDSLYGNTYFTDIAKTDTLIYKFGGFIERNSYESNAGIRSVFFYAGASMALNPVFRLNILADGTAYWIEEYNYENKEGNYRATIKPKDLDNLKRLINYINVLGLKDNYDAGATCMQTGTLEISFADGTKKRIEDYGMQGTLGLIQLYKLLSGLRENQDWK